MKIKLLYLLIIIFLIFPRCSDKRVYLKPPIKYFYYYSEGYSYVFHLKNETVRKIIPEELKLSGKNTLGMIKIKRNKKVGGGEPYLEAALFILTEFKDRKGWFLIKSIIDTSSSNVKHLRHFGYKTEFGLIKYYPTNTDFRAIVKKNYKMFLEAVFSFLPKEEYKKNKYKKLAFKLPVFIKKKNKIVLLHLFDKKNKSRITIKDGIGTFNFDEYFKKYKIFNGVKIKDIFYFEIIGNVFYKAYYLD